MRRVVLIGLLLLVIVSSGCINESEKTMLLYVCSTGQTVSDATLCPTISPPPTQSVVDQKDECFYYSPLKQLKMNESLRRFFESNIFSDLVGEDDLDFQIIRSDVEICDNYEPTFKFIIEKYGLYGEKIECGDLSLKIVFTEGEYVLTGVSSGDNRFMYTIYDPSQDLLLPLFFPNSTLSTYEKTKFPESDDDLKFIGITPTEHQTIFTVNKISCVELFRKQTTSGMSSKISPDIAELINNSIESYKLGMGK